jgi:hypothetical protein
VCVFVRGREFRYLWFVAVLQDRTLVRRKGENAATIASLLTLSAASSSFIDRANARTCPRISLTLSACYQRPLSVSLPPSLPLYSRLSTIQLITVTTRVICWYVIDICRYLPFLLRCMKSNASNPARTALGYIFIK